MLVGVYLQQETTVTIATAGLPTGGGTESEKMLGSIPAGVRGAIDAVKSGRDPSASAAAAEPAADEVDPNLIPEDTVIDSSDVITDDQVVMAGDVETPSTPETQTPQAAPAATEDIFVSDEKGRRKVSIDFTNKDQIKKYVQQAYGMRKFQVERDQARQELTRTREEATKTKTHWDSLEKAFQRDGISGVIQLIGGPEAVEKYRSDILTNAERRRHATPEQLQALDAQERAAQLERDLQLTKKEQAEFQARITSEREQAELRAYESRATPAFDRHRFSGKLGDSDTEHMFDEMLWNTTLKRLEPLEEKGVEITSEMFEKEFKQVSQALRKQVGKQAAARASEADTTRKVQAANTAQTRVARGMTDKTGGASEEATKLLREGNISGIFKNWSKFGKVFT